MCCLSVFATRCALSVVRWLAMFAGCCLMWVVCCGSLVECWLVVLLIVINCVLFTGCLCVARCLLVVVCCGLMAVVWCVLLVVALCVLFGVCVVRSFESCVA